MTLEQTLISVWRQVLTEEKRVIEIGEVRYPIARTSSKRLRNVAFEYGARRISGIEQNPRTSSRWADLARQGQRIMQFSTGGRYIKGSSTRVTSPGTEHGPASDFRIN